MSILDQWEIDVKWELKNNGYHPSNLRLSTAIAIIRKHDETLKKIIKIGNINAHQVNNKFYAWNEARQTREEVREMFNEKSNS